MITSTSRPRTTGGDTQSNTSALPSPYSLQHSLTNTVPTDGMVDWTAYYTQLEQFIIQLQSLPDIPPIVLHAGSVITSTGEISDRIYFVLGGNVATYNDQGNLVGTAGRAAFFGETEALHRIPHMYSRVAGYGGCQLVIVPVGIYLKLVIPYPAVSRYINDVARTGMNENFNQGVGERQLICDTAPSPVRSRISHIATKVPEYISPHSNQNQPGVPYMGTPFPPRQGPMANPVPSPARTPKPACSYPEEMARQQSPSPGKGFSYSNWTPQQQQQQQEDYTTSFSQQVLSARGMGGETPIGETERNPNESQPMMVCPARQHAQWLSAMPSQTTRKDSFPTMASSFLDSTRANYLQSQQQQQQQQASYYPPPGGLSKLIPNEQLTDPTRRMPTAAIPLQPQPLAMSQGQECVKPQGYPVDTKYQYNRGYQGRYVQDGEIYHTDSPGGPLQTRKQPETFTLEQKQQIIQQQLQQGRRGYMGRDGEFRFEPSPSQQQADARRTMVDTYATAYYPSIQPYQPALVQDTAMSPNFTYASPLSHQQPQQQQQPLADYSSTPLESPRYVQQKNPATPTHPLNDPYTHHPPNIMSWPTSVGPSPTTGGAMTGVMTGQGRSASPYQGAGVYTPYAIPSYMKPGMAVPGATSNPMTRSEQSREGVTTMYSPKAISVPTQAGYFSPIQNEATTLATRGTISPSIQGNSQITSNPCYRLGVIKQQHTQTHPTGMGPPNMILVPPQVYPFTSGNIARFTMMYRQESPTVGTNMRRYLAGFIRALHKHNLEPCDTNNTAPLHVDTDMHSAIV